MIYIFQRDFPLPSGVVIKKGEAVFIDDPNEKNEVVDAVKSEQERLKPKKNKE